MHPCFTLALILYLIAGAEARVGALPRLLSNINFSDSTEDDGVSGYAFFITTAALMLTAFFSSCLPRVFVCMGRAAWQERVNGCVVFSPARWWCVCVPSAPPLRPPVAFISHH